MSLYSFSPYVMMVVCLAHTANAQVIMTTGEAMKLAFPDCQIHRSTVLLDESKQAAIEKICGQKILKSMVFPYVATRKGELVGTAWFDVHKVRSKKQLLMVVLDPQQNVQRVELLAFAEPKKYQPRKRWLRKFNKQKLGGAQAGKDVPRITGATLTVRASTRCVQRTMALHRVVFGPPAKIKPTPPKKTAPAPRQKPRTTNARL